MTNSSNQKGFTLVELLVVMVVFTIIIVITAGAFKTILTQSAKLLRSEESNIEGIIGLEMMRHDLQQMGYGLFSEPMTDPYIGEATVVPALTYNEASLTAPPRALVTGDNLAAVVFNTAAPVNTFTLLAGTDYLAVKGMTVGVSKAAHRWSYLQLDASGAVVPVRWASGDDNLVANDKVVVLRRRLSASANTLAVEHVTSGGDFYFPFGAGAFSRYSSNYNKFVIYGLNESASPPPRMPYNRTDYFVARPTAAGSIPGICAPNTGVLYKSVLINSTAGDGGTLIPMPVLDCVADMQVVLMWDLRNGAAAGQDGSVDTYSSPSGTGTSGPATTAEILTALADPELLRNSLKGIKIYIMAQNGRIDPSYTYSSPNPFHVGDQTWDTNTRGRNIDIVANGWQNYRWKLYQIIVRPKNLTANQ